MQNDFECNLCGGKTGYKIPFRYAFKERFLWAVKCETCSLISIWPRPSDKEIAEMYAEDYFTGTDKQTHHMEVDYLQILSSGDYQEGVAQMKKYLPKGGHILDVGCATGHFLFALKNAGFEVAGTELSAFAAAYGNEKFGVNIVNAPFDRQLLNKNFTAGQFDLILMGDVLEHFTNPTEALRVANALLKPGGIILVQLPGTLNLLSSKLALFVFKIIGTQKTMHIPPYHLTEFSAKTARKIFEHTGFKQIKVTNEIKPPSTITLRGNFIENTVKWVMQYVNFAATKLFGIEGDRILVEARK